MEIQDVARIVLTGISYGMILFLIASGLSLILGAMGVLNLAHGSLYMLGAFIGISLAARVQPFWVVPILAGLAVGIIGLFLERVFLQRLYKQFNDQVLLTLGFVYIFSNLALWIWGGFPLLGKVPAILDFSIPLGALGLPMFRVALILIGAVIAALLWWIQDRTRAGAIVRAGMDDREMTMALGIHYARVSAAIFFLGAAIAGFAGYIGSPITGANVDMAFPILIQALIVVVVGGVGRVEGTLLGALVIGLVDSLGKTFFPDYAAFTIYVFFILILLVRPSGLLGRAPLGGGAPPPERFAFAAHGALRTFRAAWQEKFLRVAPALLLAIVLLALPPFMPAYLRSALTQILIYGLAAASLNLLFGYTGLFSLGHAAMFGIGAYTAALLVTRAHIDNFWIALVAGILVAALTAAVLGFIALRVSGIYFLFVTLALGELLAAIALKWTVVTGGSNGIFGIAYPGIVIPFAFNATTFYYLVLVVCGAGAYLMYRIVHSPFGLALQGIRDDELRMRHLGYNTHRFKYLAFVLSGAFAGAAGVLLAPASGTIVPAFLGTTTSALLMLMVIIGGARMFWGPFLGAAVILLLQYYVSIWFPERWQLVLGVSFVLAVMFLPGGIGLHLARLWNRVRYKKTAAVLAADMERITG